MDYRVFVTLTTTMMVLSTCLSLFWSGRYALQYCHRKIYTTLYPNTCLLGIEMPLLLYCVVGCFGAVLLVLVC
ncbi:hypothetical protein GGR55DRAFT_667946 [Xylaria sp. FL0064]|nr:hypothetical protein GGR55DRAFT_667946 [Xylaria sp. FL0064]